MSAHLHLHFEKLPGKRKPEWIVTGLDNGTILVTPEIAKELQVASQAGRLFPYQIIDWQNGVDPDGEPCCLLTIGKTYDTKVWGFDE